MLAEVEVCRTRNGDLEILLPAAGGRYQVVLERSYGKGVFNPDSTITDLITGRRLVDVGGRKLLHGTHLNGECPADCEGCPFGRTAMRGSRIRARPIEPTELKGSIDRACQIARGMSMLGMDEKFSAGALLSGDPGFSPHVAGLIKVVSTYPNCRASRWSTIAPQTGDNVLEAFIEGARQVTETEINHTLSFQVSLQSTDPEVRIKHTGWLRLLPPAEIADASQTISQITGRRMSLAFVLHARSVIDPNVLSDNFSPQSNIISLRPIYSPDHQPMEPDRILGLYHQLREGGWDVVYMPPNISHEGDGRPIELDNMVSGILGLAKG